MRLDFARSCRVSVTVGSKYTKNVDVNKNFYKKSCAFTEILLPLLP